MTDLELLRIISTIGNLCGLVGDELERRVKKELNEESGPQLEPGADGLLTKPKTFMSEDSQTRGENKR